MTPQRLAILEFVRERIATTGYSPTYAEIAEKLGYRSKGPIHSAIGDLVADGLLLREPGRNRGLSLPGVDLKAVPTVMLKAELERREQSHG